MKLGGKLVDDGCTRLEIVTQDSCWLPRSVIYCETPTAVCKNQRRDYCGLWGCSVEHRVTSKTDVYVSSDLRLYRVRIREER